MITITEEKSGSGIFEKGFRSGVYEEGVKDRY